MASKFERRLKKEAAMVKTPDLLASIYQNIGEDMPVTRKKWYANRLLWGAAAAAVVLIAAAVPVSIYSSSNSLYADSYISLTINPKGKAELESDSEETTSSNEASFSIQVNKKKEIQALESNDTNSRIIRCGIDQSATSVSGFIRNVIQASARTGYINKESKKNYISLLVTSSNEKTAQRMKALISKAIIRELSSNYIYGYLLDEVSEYNENTEVLAKNLNITMDKYILLQKVNSLYYNVFSEDYLSSLEYDELYALISKANEVSYCCPDGLEESMQALKEAKDDYFNEVILPLMKSLVSLQEEIDTMQSALNSSLSKEESETYKAYLSYNYQDEMHASMSENAFGPEGMDFWQMMIWNSPYSARRITVSEKENETSGYTIDQLVEKVDSSRELLSEVITSIHDFAEIEKQFETPTMEDCAFFYANNYSRLFDEHANECFDEEWISNYQDAYSDDSDYWYHR